MRRKILRRRSVRFGLLFVRGVTVFAVNVFDVLGSEGIDGRLVAGFVFVVHFTGDFAFAARKMSDGGDVLQML